MAKDKLEVSKQHLVGAAVAVVVVAVLVLGSHQHGSLGQAIAFLFSLVPFGLKLTGAGALAFGLHLGLVYMRSLPRADKHAGAVEMGAIRSRIGTEDERANDALAVGISYAAATLSITAMTLVIVVVLSRH